MQSVEFYKIEFYINGQLSLLQSDDDVNLKEEYWQNVYESIKNDYLNKDYYIIEDTNFFIEFKESNENCIFGILGKSDQIKNGILQRVYNENNTDITGLYLEKYCYFYLRKSDLYISVLKNYQVPSFSKKFSSFLKSYINPSNRIESVEVIRVLDKEIKTKIFNSTEILNLNLVFSKDSTADKELLPLRQSFDLSNSNMVKGSINIKFNNQPISDTFKSYMENDEMIKSNYDKFKVVSDSPQGQETFEIVKGWLTKSIDIEIDDEDLIEDNLDIIKEALKSSLSS